VRVLHVITRMNVGGVAALVLNLARGLPDHGVEVVLATGQVQEGEAEVADLPAGTLRVQGLGRSPRPGDDLRALHELRALVRRLRPDVVHTHTAKAGFLGRLAVEGLGIPRVHTFHGHLLQGYFSPAVTRAVTLAERALAARTDLIISSGGRVGEELRAAGVGRRARWLDIPPGVVPPTPSGTPELRTVAFVGRLVGVKRVDRLVEAARLLPGVRFLVAGDGPLRASLEATAPANVAFLGWTGDVGAVYGRAQLVLLCSDNEAMPLALIEGALCGLPGVTTDAGSAAEVVEHGRTGLVCGPSPEDLAAAIRELLDDEPRRAAMGSAARAAAQARHTVAAMSAAHATAYASVTGPNG
jgi:glycosyltransferase involved in cell wall biosynthesis